MTNLRIPPEIFWGAIIGSVAHFSMSNAAAILVARIGAGLVRQAALRLGPLYTLGLFGASMLAGLS